MRYWLNANGQTIWQPAQAQEVDPQLLKDDIRKRLEADGKSGREVDSKAEVGKRTVRISLMDAVRGDPNGYERIIDESDLVTINFLDRGRRVADAVCRIKVPMLGQGWYGTGFLVGPRLLMTNNHVLSSPADASQAEAEFGYEADLDGVLKLPVRFNLAPHEAFFTDVHLDVTFVAVAPYSEGGVPLDRYGRLPLLPMSGKGLDGEWVTIIQHPGAAPKQIAIRANQIIELSKKDIPGTDDVYFKRFIHYSTDTEPGSSGAPVLNDQWQVVAIHHKAIPAANLSKGRPRLRKKRGNWIANEGVRISAIFKALEELRFSDQNVATVLERLEQAIGLEPLVNPQFKPTPSPDVEADRAAYDIAKWKDWGSDDKPLGYDANFLTTPLTLDGIVEKAKERIALLKNGSRYLHYLHFSTVIDRDRKFPMLTAVNISGHDLKNPGGRSDSWRRDARIADEFQPAGNFYEKSRGTDPVQFSRGHLVRRIDPCWGSMAEAKLAEQHTFHYTNSTPQVQKYNDTDWGDLEDYVLNQAQIKEKKMTVLSGPIFKENDPKYGRDRDGGPWQIPISYWKIAVIQKTESTIAAVGFILGQLEYVQALYEARVFTALSPYTLTDIQQRKIQATIQTIEAETGLSFGHLRHVDTLSALESTRQVRFLRNVSEIIV